MKVSRTPEQQRTAQSALSTAWRPGSPMYLGAVRGRRDRGYLRPCSDVSSMYRLTCPSNISCT